jgi:hypothetical protein
MHVTRALKGKRIEDSRGIGVMFEVMLKFAHVCSVRSLAMSFAIGQTGGGCNEIAEIWVVRIVKEGYENVRAEAR